MGPLSQELYSEIVSLASQGMIVVDAASPDIEILYANAAYAEASGYPAAELAGASWIGHAVADEASSELMRLKQALACTEPVTLSLPFLRKDGDIWLGRFRLVPLEGGLSGRRLMLVEHVAEDRSAASDTELLKRALGRARRKIASLDRTDVVTGLLSGSEFRLMLRREIALARRNAQALHLILFSIPELDIYRQTFGNNAADSCVRMIGAQIAGTFRRAGDLCARIDESTIAVAVHALEDEQAGRLVVQVETKARNLGLHNPRGRVGRYVLTRGAVVAADPKTDDVDALMSRASRALEAAGESPALSVASSA